MAEPLIDVWDVETFDAELRQLLVEKAELLRGYHTTARENLIQRELSDRTARIRTTPSRGTTSTWPKR